MRFLLLDATLGLLLLAVIALAARRRKTRISSLRIRTFGWTLIAFPLPAAVVAHLTLQLRTNLDQALFIAGIASFATGAAILLGHDDDDWHQEREEEPPPW